jgi:hypothetical protein
VNREGAQVHTVRTMENRGRVFIAMIRQCPRGILQDKRKLRPI